MAAIEISGNDQGILRSRKISTRVDMTPMVDLGFLLITFFMLATTMTKPTAMSVAVPKSDDASDPIRASGVLTLFLGANDEIYYLDGLAADDEKAPADLKATAPGSALRKVIFASQQRVGALRGKEGHGSEELVVVIKPTNLSSYKNVVDVLDEMAITKSKRYALVDKLTDSEKTLLRDKIATKE